MTTSSTSQAATVALPDGESFERATSAPDALAESARYCRKLTRARAKNFYYGMMLTPRDRRDAMYAVYAWMRAVDDLADAPGDSDAVKRRKLEAFRRRTHAAIDGRSRSGHDAFVDEGDPSAAAAPAGDDPFPALWPAAGDAFRRFDVPRDCLDDMIDGQLIDQDVTRYPSFQPLYDYCYKVAGTVGLVCLSVWGFEGGDATRDLAEQRGAALQLTNILRDVVEDARRDRVYLPADELASYGFDAASFKAFVLDAAAKTRVDRNDETALRFHRLMRFQLARARRYYQQSAPLESFVTPGCRPTCWALMRIYERLLRKMEKRPMRVLTERVRLPVWEKLLIACRATLRRGLHR